MHTKRTHFTSHKEQGEIPLKWSDIFTDLLKTVLTTDVWIPWGPPREVLSTVAQEQHLPVVSMCTI